MSTCEPKQIADSMRVVRKNTITIAEDIPEAHCDYRPTQDSRSVLESRASCSELSRSRRSTVERNSGRLSRSMARTLLKK